MSGDTLSIPRRTGGLTAYAVNDGDTITQSTKSWDLVQLTAKKIAVLAKYSSELAEDAIINVADDLAGEIAYAFAKFEDQCAFVGDGTSTYVGIVGFGPAFTNLTGTYANIAGAYVMAATGGWPSAVIADFNNCKGRLPAYAAADPACCWIMSQQFWSSTAERVALAAGGITTMDIAQGQPPRFMGYPVKLTPAMPIVTATNQVCALFGAFHLAAAFGDRRMTTIAVSEHVDFASDQLNIRGTERFDINVHDVGNQSATAASRVAGPVVALMTAAS